MPAPIDRRAFLGGVAGTTALLTVPGALAGCAKQGLVAAPLPANPFFDWFGVDEAMLSRLMSELTANGADAADLFFQHTRSSGITLEDGIVGRAWTRVDQGVGNRVVIGDQTGYAFTEDLTEEAIRGAARTASSIARTTPGVAPVAFALRDHGDYYAIGVPWSDVGVDRKLAILRKVEAAALAADPAVTRVKVRWNDDDERVLLADAAGNLVVDVRPMTRLWCEVTAKRGDEVQTGNANVAGREGIDWYDDARLDMLVKQAVERTLVLFDAVRPPAGELPVVLAAGASGILLHEAIGHGMEADFNRKGTSIYADKIGEKVAPDFVTIVDDGTVDNARGALNVDDEGTPGQRTVLVDKGVMSSFLHDGISARHYGVPSTGSGRRQSFRHKVLPRMRCTYMEDGPHTREEIIASVDKGIIAETFRNGQVQIGAGDFTFFIRNGWLIENGKVTAPIKDVNIIGNGPDALANVTMAANDSALDTGGWTCGKDGQSVPVSQGLPTVLVSSLNVGGENA
jgi:TldD protein